MKKIFFIITFIILVMLLMKSYKNKEYFSNNDTIKTYNTQIVIKKNETLQKILTYMKYMYNEIERTEELRFNDILSSSNNELNNTSLDNLLNVILIIFIIQGNTDSFIYKNNLKKLIDKYFGNYIIIKKNKNYNDTKRINQSDISIQIPMNILQTINWNHYEKIFYESKKKYNDNRLYLKDILEIKKTMLIQHFINSQIPMIRSLKIKDKENEKYSQNYMKIINSEKKTNYETKVENNNYSNFEYNFTINFLIEIYNNLQMKKKSNKLFYKKIYSHSLYDNNIPFSLIMGNLYMPSLEDFELIINKIKSKLKRKKKVLPNNWTQNNTNYLSNIEYYPYRFQYPLNYNCQRVWYNCYSKDRINDYYKYYSISKNNDKNYSKTYNMADFSFAYN
jgi:hypothetical protein